MLCFSQHGRIDGIRSQLWKSCHLTHEQSSSCWLYLLSHFRGWQHTSLGHRGRGRATSDLEAGFSPHSSSWAVLLAADIRVQKSN